MKVLIRFFILSSTFLLSWWLLAQVDWVSHLQIEEYRKDTDQKLTEFIKEQIEKSEKVIKDKEIIRTIDSIVHVITRANNLEADRLEVMLVVDEQINAFALPQNYLILNSGLILACDKPEALAGVIAHELSHIKMRHVEKKLMKELGVAVLISSAGGGGSEVLQQVLRTLTSTAYDRSLEREADEYAVRLLLNAQINPEPLAEFFYELSLNNTDLPKALGWVSTHDDSRERAEAIMESLEYEELTNRPMIDKDTWQNLKTKLGSF